MKIPVYILPTQIQNISTSNTLKKIFGRNRIFKVIKHSQKKKIVDPVTEANQVIEALYNASKCFPEDFCIIIKDTSVTNSTTEEIVKIILSAIDINKDNKYCKKHNWQLCYLTKWLDRCDLYKEEAKIKGVTKIVKTFSPLGIQSILFSPEGRDIIIGKHRMNNGKFFIPPINSPLGDQFNLNIGLGNINATCVVPNLFNFNVMLSTNDIDFLKQCECRQPTTEQSKGPGAIPFLWFVIVMASVILLAWFFYQIVGKENIRSGVKITRTKK